MDASRTRCAGALALALSAVVIGCGVRSKGAPEEAGGAGEGTAAGGAGAELRGELEAWLEPSRLQRELAATEPAPALPPSDEQRQLRSAIERYFRQRGSYRYYVAVDKPLYRPGETIWFRAFEMSTPDLTSGSSGYGVTAQLLNPQGAAVASKQVRVKSGAIANDFKLRAGLPGGEYTLRLRARGGPVERTIMVSSYEPPQIQKDLEFLRKAYGAGDQVAATLSLNRGTGEPLANTEVVALATVDGAEVVRQPVTTGGDGAALVAFSLPEAMDRGDGLLTILVEDGGVTESIQRRIPIVLDELDVELYPEGGDLITGLPHRVYFAAEDAKGDPADIAGAIVDDEGNEVAGVRSLHDGMGRFEITPEPGRSYELRVDSPPDIEATYPLPEAGDAGCSLQSVDDFEGDRGDVRVAIWCSERAPVVATAALRERHLGTVRIEAGPDEPAVVSMPVPPGAQGAARVTLFSEGEPVAERLVYRGRGRDLEVEIEPGDKSYTPREEVELAIQTRDLAGEPVSADLALSVVDDRVLSYADDDTSHLLARVFVESEMPGQEIEEPNFYFSDEPLASRGLDLLLGTKGWRRFSWERVLDPTTARQPAGAGGRAEAREVELAAGPVEAEEEAAPPPGAPAPRGAEDDAFGGPAGEGGADGSAAPQPEPAQRQVAAGEVRAAEPPPDDLDRAAGVVADRARRARRARPIRQGFAPVREFPVPSYEAGYDGPRDDFRETVYWAHSIETGDDGKARVSFPLSDSVTSFRAIAEGVSRGGLPGRGETTVRSVLPVSLSAKPPLEVSDGDVIELPISIANETDRDQRAELEAEFGDALTLRTELPERLRVPAGQRRSFFAELEVDGSEDGDGAGLARLSLRAAGFTDEIERELRVVPRGFPREIELAGTLSGGGRAVHEVNLAGAVRDSVDAQIALYPSPLATMVSGVQSMVREPTGCFEQASSANYPNIMVLRYLEEHGEADPALVERTQGLLDRGYQKLTGYESPERGYEWFGGDPGHEALTAYGLLQFGDMRAVYGDVDAGMVQRTRRWLMSRRDGEGGYEKNPRALDSFGRASDEVTAGYITYALAEAGETDLEPELAAQRERAETTDDPYLMALATHVLLELAPESDDASRAVGRLAGMQGDDGSFPGADHSITRSGGRALAIETTSLAAMALMKAGDENLARVRGSVEWLNGQRGGFGGYGSTQSTVLALKALSQYAELSRATRAGGRARVLVNGREVGRVAFEQGRRDPIELGGVADALEPGENQIVIELDSETDLPYSAVIEYTSPRPASSPDAPIAVSASLASSEIPVGEGVRLDVRVDNTTDEGQPMALARVGLPGGLALQTWQLEELVDEGTIDFFETREREVILYFRSMAPGAERSVPIELLAAVPGQYEGPASRSYLYYTDELVRWEDPLSVEIRR